MFSAILAIIFSLIQPLPQINGYTHWIVTENGGLISQSIQPLATSFYHLRQSWNLLQLIEQENRVKILNKIDKRLDEVSQELQNQQQIQNQIQKYYLDVNSPCVKANKLLSEIDLNSAHILTLETKGFLSETFINRKKLDKISENDLEQPFCLNYFNQEFSMCCYEHLDSIKHSSNITGVPEIALYKIAFPQYLTPSEYGHLVNLELKENYLNPSKNWIYYNMAAFYWRVKGLANEAINCLRAAIHLSKSYSRDAIIFMQNAALISPYFASHQIILGNLFAELGDFNQSLYHYEKAEMLFKPKKDKIKLKDIRDRIFAAKCSFELNRALSYQQLNLNKHLTEIDLYQSKTQEYQTARAIVEYEQTPNITQIQLNNAFLQISQLDSKTGQEHQETQNTLINCSITEPNSSILKICDPQTKSILIDALVNKNKFIHKDKSQYKLHKKSPIYPLNYTYNLSDPIYPRLYKRLHKEDFSKWKMPHQSINSDWENCRINKCWNSQFQHLTEDHLAFFLSPKNKGFELQRLFNEAQNLSSKSQHPKPWNEPLCELNDDQNKYPQDLLFIRNLSLGSRVRIKETHVLWQELVKILGHQNFFPEEVGQRLLTAMKHHLAPKWLLFNLASLYWRVRGYVQRALQCSKNAIKVTPTSWLDISLVNLAALLLQPTTQLQHTLAIHRLVELALSCDYSEPVTHMLASKLHLLHREYAVAMHHVTLAIQQERNWNLVGYTPQHIICWMCYEHYKQQSKPSHNTTKLRQLYIKYKICASNRNCVVKHTHIPHIKLSKCTQQSFDKLLIEHTLLWSFETNPIHIQNYLKKYVDTSTKDDSSNIATSISSSQCLVYNDTTVTSSCQDNPIVLNAARNVIRFMEELNEMLSEKSVNFIKFLHPQEFKQERTPNNNTHNLFEGKNSFYQIPITQRIVNTVKSRIIVNPMSAEDCDQVAPFNFRDDQPIYASLDSFGVKISHLLDKFSPGFSFLYNQQPICAPAGTSVLRRIIDKYQINFDVNSLANMAEYHMSINLLETFDNRYKEVNEIGQRLYAGFQHNKCDWLLATISVNFWRIKGSAHNAFQCLELAFENGPYNFQKMLLISAIDILYRIGQYDAALEIAYLSLTNYPISKDWMIIHFLVGNIFSHLNQWKKAILFYQAASFIHEEFDSTISRIRSIQCHNIVQETLHYNSTMSN